MLRMSRASQEAAEEAAAIREHFPNLGAQREMLRLIAEQERWLQRLKRKYRLTNRELRKHCVISTWTNWDAEAGRVTVRRRFSINWTLWMRFKRWLRRKL